MGDKVFTIDAWSLCEASHKIRWVSAQNALCRVAGLEDCGIPARGPLGKRSWRMTQNGLPSPLHLLSPVRAGSVLWEVGVE